MMHTELWPENTEIRQSELGKSLHKWEAITEVSIKEDIKVRI
jgi:hypothetical protein